MNFNDYQREAEKTINHELTGTEPFSVAALGLNGEAGEVGEKFKKWIGQGHTLNIEEVAEELGDCLWYIAYIATLIQTPLSVIASYNIGKLRRRYNGGGFDADLSRNRNLNHAGDSQDGVWADPHDGY